MSYYLQYSANVKQINGNRGFYINYAFAWATCLFYLTDGKIAPFFKSEYAYFHWGVLLFFILIWDFYRLFINENSNKVY